MKKIIACITGASGSVYFLRLMSCLAQQEAEVHIIASEQGEKVFAYETGLDFKEQVKRWSTGKATVLLEDNSNLFSSVASGSYRCDAMVILPCSMSTAAEIATGVTKTLLTRAADVMIKEQRKLVLVPRETPLSAIHLKNLYELSKLGVTILPAMPGFYNQPKSIEDIIDFIAGKAMDCMGLENCLYQRWEGIHHEDQN